MTLRILHIFDHFPPLHSGYTFCNAKILREKLNRKWQAVYLNSNKQVNRAGMAHALDVRVPFTTTTLRYGPC